jgi:hypothetical protein
MLLGADVTHWPANTADKVPTIFNVDKKDPPCFDVYTNGTCSF